jgi:uncharacterized membrane protein
MQTDEAKLRTRIYSVDLLRGIVMMIMLLDHTRDFIQHDALLADPTDMSTTNVALFFTRWITHFCAPIFVFLSGVSIYLQRMNGKTNKQLSWFLFTRGLWLILLELTVIRLLVTFNLDYGTLFGMPQVIWVIGVSMIVMAALIYLPLWFVGSLGVITVVLHNLLDSFNLPPQIAFAPTKELTQSLWLVLHQQGLVPVGGSVAFILYPLIPWVGVMAAGYALGVVYSWDAARRKSLLLTLGIIATVLFVAVRASNYYGDPVRWSTEDAFVEFQKARVESGPQPPGRTFQQPEMTEPAFSIVSFLNTTKYPPSLIFLLMTLGPGLIVLGLADDVSGEPFWQRIPIVFGRVPMFYYLLQWAWAHGFAVLLSLLAGKEIGYYFNALSPDLKLPEDNGFSLPVVYLVWILGLVAIYPLCYWYGNLKRRKKHWLLSYL